MRAAEGDPSPPAGSDFPMYSPNNGRVQRCLSGSLSAPGGKRCLVMQISFTRPPIWGWGDLPAASPPLAGSCPALTNRCGRPRSCPYLVVADGHRGVQEVPDLPQALETFCLQPQALGVALEDGFVDEQTDLLDLGHLQSLRGGKPLGRGGWQPRGVNHGPSPDQHGFWSETVA